MRRVNRRGLREPNVRPVGIDLNHRLSFTTAQINLEVLQHKDVAATECPGDLFPGLEINQALNNPSCHDNMGGNTMEPWKNELLAQAMDKKLISQSHDPDEPAPKWFVLAVGLKILQEVESRDEKQ